MRVFCCPARFWQAIPAVRVDPARTFDERGAAAVGTPPERHVLGVHHAGGELQRVLEIELRIRCPFSKRFQCIAEELAILEARPKTWRFVPELRGNGADNVADRSEERGFAPMSP